VVRTERTEVAVSPHALAWAALADLAMKRGGNALEDGSAVFVACLLSSPLSAPGRG
jgi:hypothetical protein